MFDIHIFIFFAFVEVSDHSISIVQVYHSFCIVLGTRSGNIASAVRESIKTGSNIIKFRE